jgi:hypothetical protein
MCQNYPNCNCPSCTQCQDCTQVTPTCVTTITTSCTTEQFTEECPNGLQSTDCLVYTGDTLKDCENNDFLFRGTKFNTFLSQLWETVKCAATATTDTIDYTGAAIKTCDNNTTIVPTNTPVTTALNNIWNHIKCWNSSLTTLINDRQPVWKAGYPIVVGPTLSAPFNNINTAITEITKYHHDVKGPVRIQLAANTNHTLSSNVLTNWNSQSGSFQIESMTGSSATLNFPAGLIIDSFNLILDNLYVQGDTTIMNGGHLRSTNCLHRSLSSGTTLFTLKNSANLTTQNSRFLGLADGEGIGTLNSRHCIYAENNSTVNIITEEESQDGYYTFFDTLFNIIDNSSLVIKNTTIQQTERIAKVLRLNNNSKASFLGSFIEFSGENASVLNNIAFVVRNNSNLYTENIKINGYFQPFNIENNSNFVFGGTLDTNTATRFNVLNNSSFIGNPNSILTGNFNNTGSVFHLNDNSTINLFSSIVTFTNVAFPNYTLRNNSKAIFKSGAILPIPTSGNSQWGDATTAVVINNIVNTSTNINSIGCGYLIFP